MDTTKISAQVVSLRDLLSSTLVATIDADTATAQRYFTNMCNLAFESYNAETNEAGSLRTLTFQYTGMDGTVQTLEIPILSLVPLPLLQVKDADFGFNVSILSMQPSEKDDFFLLEELPDSYQEGQQQDRLPRLQVALRPLRPANRSDGESTGSYLPNMKVNVRLHQADLPGGLSRFLQFVNNMEFKSVENNKIKDDTEHE